MFLYKCIYKHVLPRKRYGNDLLKLVSSACVATLKTFTLLWSLGIMDCIGLVLIYRSAHTLEGVSGVTSFFSIE